MTAKYAGIGARKTPADILAQMTLAGSLLGARGFELQSGAAAGADTAFETGARMVNGPMRIRLGTSYRPVLDHAAYFHPAWDKCDGYAKALHARNSLIMVGDDLASPVSFVVCWTPGGAVVGGTGQALRIAEYYKIPVFNLAVTRIERLWEWLG